MPIILNPLQDAVYPARTISYTGTAGVTATWQRGANAVQVMCTTAAYVIVGEAVTATASNGIPVAANVPVTLSVPAGGGKPWRVSAIQIASGGDVYCKPLGNSM